MHVPGRRVLYAWMVAYVVFLIHAFIDADGFLLIDYTNLVFHEAGHVLLGFLGIIGGTVGQCLPPAMTLAWFLYRQELTGAAFGLFWLGTNFRYIGWYMSDARTQALPLIGTGEHDWYLLFSAWGILEYDTRIGGAFKVLGYLTMIGAIIWLAARTLSSRSEGMK